MIRSSVRSAGLVLALSAVASLTGCASLGLGEAEFACPGRPPGVRCASAAEVYALTEHIDHIDATGGAALGDEAGLAVDRLPGPDDPDPANPEASTPPTPAVVVTPVSAPARLPRSAEPRPVRTPAQVMRVWLAPWEDTAGVLHTGGYQFTEIEARRWSVGARALEEPARLFSLQRPAPERAGDVAAGSTSLPTPRIPPGGPPQ